MQADQNRNASHNRRRFLVNSAVGATTAAGVATKFSTFASAGSVAAADTALPRVESFPAPSNALVTGVDPTNLSCLPSIITGCRISSPSLWRSSDPHCAIKTLFFGAEKRVRRIVFLQFYMELCFGRTKSFECGMAPSTVGKTFSPTETTCDWLMPKVMMGFIGSSLSWVYATTTAARQTICAPWIAIATTQCCYTNLTSLMLTGRYKMAFVGYHHDKGLRKPLLCVAFSGDGLHWTNYEENPVIHGSWSEISGIYRWKGLYYVNGQTGWPLSGVSKPKRTMINFASPDFLNWEQAGAISFWRHDLSDPSSPASRSQVHLGASVWHRRNVCWVCMVNGKEQPAIKTKTSA